MTTPLWSDERIASDVDTLALDDKAHRLLKAMRDEYEARVAELQSLVDAYAQRVMDQDTEIGILRQREEWTHCPARQTRHPATDTTSAPRGGSPRGGAMTLKPLEQHNAERGEFYAFKRNPHPNGIACPACGQELWDSSPLDLLTSNPPKKNIHCPACGYTGYRIA